MDFDLTADQKLFRATTREFLDKEMPLTRVRELADLGIGFEADWWKRGSELGWNSMIVGPDWGGDSISGEGLVDTCIVAEEMGRLVSPGPLLGANVVAATLGEAANAADHADVIAALMADEAVASWAVYEPARGWSPLTPAVRATADGSGYVLSGVKDRVDCGDQADYFLVTAAGPDGLAQFVVPAAAPGVTVTAEQSLDLVRRYARVDLDGVRLPATSFVSPAETAEAAVNRQIQIAVALQCAETAGAVSRVFEFTVQWAFDRYSFGRPLASYQALKHRFADMKLWLEAGAATASAAAHAAAQRCAEADELASVAKSYVGQRATDIIQDCVQMHGGIGVTWEHDIHLYLRRATVNRTMFGTPSEHRRRLADILGV
ncbi:MAG TPA: acyl-CoA dehydrogenase family protein [Streptosporangiaceae bacterium]|nr:acyl-CoA dehydrogenase family protein [Streptosporangiaceae bacterium]